MGWAVTVAKRVQKRVVQLPQVVQNAFLALIKDIESHGPIRGDWHNYSSLGRHRYHCHLKKGHPTYVAVWEVSSLDIKIVEIIYVGTHENAPY